jgi:hypothetical protein
MDIIGFEGQMNGFFDRFSMKSKIRKAQEQQKKMIQQKMNQQQSNQPSKLPGISSDQKKRMIMSLVNSMNGVEEITGFDNQVGSFAKLMAKMKKKVTPASQIRFVKKATPQRLKAIELAKRQINAKKIQDRKVAEIIQARAKQLEAKSKPTVKQLFNAKPTPQLVNKLNSAQRSFLKTDLPYQSPNYDFAIEPPVDRGTVNFYGK